MIKKSLRLLVKKMFWGFLRHVVTDRQYAIIRYWLKFGEKPDIEEPSLFTEKIQFIKLYERTDFRRMIADRTAVRDYVSTKVGEKHLVPLHGVFKSLTAEVWEKLPKKFVLKANHGCGMLEIVTNKEQADYQSIYQNTERWKNFDYARYGREWVYEDLDRTLLAEQLLLNPDQSIPEDYKFFCFGGEVKIIQVDFGRFGNQTRNLYDRNFTRLEAELLYPNYEGEVNKPKKLEEAIEIAEELSNGVSFVRVDLYIMENEIYFGELTNYPGNGFVEFSPPSLALRAGSYINLN